jgi:hypothetical protein
MNDYFQFVYNEFLLHYGEDYINRYKQELFVLMKKTGKEARERYPHLKDPKTTSINNYVKCCVRYAIDYELAIKGLKSLADENVADRFKHLKAYFDLVPVDASETIALKIYNAKREEREDIWKSSNLPIKEIDKRFKSVCKEKIIFATSKGFSNLLELQLDHKQITQKEYKRFIEHIDAVIDFCNIQLPAVSALPSWFYSEFNTPCLLCEIPNFPLKTQEDVFNLMAKHHPVLITFKEKILIQGSDSSYMHYVRETDSFEICIDKNENFRHSCLSLIHELSHVVNYLDDFQKGKNPHSKNSFHSEKKELETELKIRRALSPEIYNSFFCEALVLFWKILFQIEMYTNPQNNASKVSAKIFNRCFKNVHQKKNYFYVLDEKVVMQPFKALPHAIANADAILDIMK